MPTNKFINYLFFTAVARTQYERCLCRLLCLWPLAAPAQSVLLSIPFLLSFFLYFYKGQRRRSMLCCGATFEWFAFYYSKSFLVHNVNILVKKLHCKNAFFFRWELMKFLMLFHFTVSKLDFKTRLCFSAISLHAFIRLLLVCQFRMEVIVLPSVLCYPGCR